MEIFTDSAEATQEAGRKLSSSLAKGDVVALKGDLGAGKTTFIQGIAKGLGIKERVTSPTFIIMRTYDAKSSGYDNFYHVDLYRLERNLEAEIDNLGLGDIIKSGKSIVVIEWAEKIAGFLPDNTRWINIKHIEGDKRKIIIK